MGDLNYHLHETTICLEGAIDLLVAAELADLIGMHIAEGLEHFTFDLSEVEFLDSTGIGALLIPARSGRVVTVVGATGRVERVLRLAGLDSFLKEK